MKTPFVDFRPAEYHETKKGGYVSYYILNPADNKMHRKQIHINRIKTKTERKRYALHLCHVINDKLYNGWNPYKDYGGIRGLTMTDSIEMFKKDKSKFARDTTTKSYRSMGKIFMQWLSETCRDGMELNDFTGYMVNEYLDWVDERRKPSNRTYNNYIIFIKTLFNYFVEKGILQENPLPVLKERKVDSKRRKPIPPDVRKLIKDYVIKKCPPFYYIMLLCYKCFIRPKEIVGLKIGDIDYMNGNVTVQAEIAKNHKERTLKVPDEIMMYFVTIAQKKPSWYIFADSKTFVPGRKAIWPTRISEFWAAMREELDLPSEYEFYSLKDTGITEMLEAGVPSKYVKELADHSSLEITEKYIHKSDVKAVQNCNMLHF